MATYHYKGVMKNGKEVKGSGESSSKQVFTNELLQKGIYVTSISEVKLAKDKFEKLSAFFASKQNLADTFFQMSLLLRSGIPLIEALKIITKTTKNVRLKNALLESAARVSEGMRFSDSLARYPNIFDPMYTNLIKASEHVGRLAEVLADISKYEENKRKNTDKLSSAMIYPMAILILGMGILGFLLAYVIPKMESIFSSLKQKIPASTQFLLDLSKFITEYGFPILIFFLSLIFTFRYLFRNHLRFRLYIDKKLYKMNIISNLAVAKFSHVLAFQLREGLPLTDAIGFANMTLDNRYLQNVIAEIRISIQGGTKFSTAVKNAGIFPELFPAAVSTGESSGNMPDLLDRVNEFYSKQVDKFLTSFVTLIEPLFIVIIGLMVGFIVISIMSPLFQMNTLVR